MIYIVTGTSSGLGYEIARLLSRDNSVIGISRTLGDAVNIKNETFNFVEINLASEKADIVTLLKRCVRPLLKNEYYTIVLNAGIFHAGDDRPSFEIDQKLMDVNYLAQKLIVQELDSENLRRILIVNSISVLVCHRDQHEYCASKHALQGYAKSLIRSARDKPYDVMVINPGGIKTPLWNHWPNDNVDDFLDCKMLADLILYMLKIPHSVYIENLTILPSIDIH